MKVKVNQDACIGCGACFSIAEDIFEMDENGLSKEKVEVVEEDKQEMAQEAAESCPTAAITVE